MSVATPENRTGKQRDLGQGQKWRLKHSPVSPAPPLGSANRITGEEFAICETYIFHLRICGEGYGVTPHDVPTNIQPHLLPLDFPLGQRACHLLSTYHEPGSEPRLTCTTILKGLLVCRWENWGSLKLSLAQGHSARTVSSSVCETINYVTRLRGFMKGCQACLPLPWPAVHRSYSGFYLSTTGLFDGIHSALTPEPNVRCTQTDRHSEWLFVLLSPPRIVLKSTQLHNAHPSPETYLPRVRCQNEAKISSVLARKGPWLLSLRNERRFLPPTVIHHMGNSHTRKGIKSQWSKQNKERWQMSTTG